MKSSTLLLIVEDRLDASGLLLEATRRSNTIAGQRVGYSRTQNDIKHYIYTPEFREELLWYVLFHDLHPLKLFKPIGSVVFLVMPPEIIPS